MFTAFLCIVALGAIAASAVCSAKAMRKMDATYADRIPRD